LKNFYQWLDDANRNKYKVTPLSGHAHYRKLGTSIISATSAMIAGRPYRHLLPNSPALFAVMMASTSTSLPGKVIGHLGLLGLGGIISLNNQQMGTTPVAPPGRPAEDSSTKKEHNDLKAFATKTRDSLKACIGIVGKIQTEIEALKQGNQDLSKKTEKVVEALGKQLDTVRTNSSNEIQVVIRILVSV
jgi:hypothetical protein